MSFIVPTNWDDELIESIKGLPVTEVFGKLHSDYFGGGRPSLYIPSVRKKTVPKHIALIHRHGYTFNYLLNTTCMNNEEFSIKGQYTMQRFMEWLIQSGVDSVTVAIPYLARWLKKHYPTVKIKASIIANIDTIQKAIYWQDLGVESMMLSLDSNRDFTFLESITKTIKCKVSLIVNLACVRNCIFSQYHYALGSHASQSSRRLKGFYIDYCSFFCRYFRLCDPTQIIRSCWIRPEDISYYEDIGIASFKIVGRILPTDRIIKIVKAYGERNHKGNLLDILSPFVGQSQFNFEKYARGLKYLLRPFRINVFHLINLKRATKDNFMYLDNQSLNNFLKGFKNKNCRLMHCDECHYCHTVAENALRVDETTRDKEKRLYENILNIIESGKIFRYI